MFILQQTESLKLGISADPGAEPEGGSNPKKLCSYSSTWDRTRRFFFTTVENEDGSSMPVVSRITVCFGSACLARWGQSAVRTMRQRQQRPPTSIPTISRAESLKTSTGLVSELGPCFPAQVSRHSSMSSSMSQRLVWVDLEVGRCFKWSVLIGGRFN